MGSKIWSAESSGVEASSSSLGRGASAGESAQGQCIRIGSLRKDFDIMAPYYADVAWWDGLGRRVPDAKSD